tara:strand:- start:97 stop:1419 length:1323 start_codon:yes stop_codon:yes gene_type:complete
MATFEAQVEALTSLTISGSSAPTQTELSQFLSDGAMEVINAMPPNLKMFCATEDTFTSTAVGSESETLTSAKVLFVTRRDGSSVEQPCRRVSASLRGRVSDSDDMMAATVSDPVYYVYDGKLNVLPASGACKYLEITSKSVEYGDSSIASFPDEYEYLVPLYASVKSIQNKLGSLGEGLSALNITDSAPTIPSLATVGYSNASNADASASSVGAITVSTVSVASVSGSAPSYTPPKVAGVTEELTATITAGVKANAGDQIDVTDWWDVLADMIETDEDTELAGAQLQKINSYINAYQSALQNQLNVFNKENALYQATVKASLDKHQTDLQVSLNQSRIDAEDARQEASQTTDVDKFNKAQDQALNLANAAKTIEGVIANNSDLIQKFNGELNKYSALVNKGVQQYQINLQNSTAEYGWWEKQQLKLQADYDKGIQTMKGS